ncbi:MAG: right-handed parallel beta-helix repeat-containing protein [Armatimonadota bacterium]
MTHATTFTSHGWAAAVAALSVAGVLCQSVQAAPLALYVSTKGNDAWTGRSREARPPDGPFATLAQARDELRRLRREARLTDGATVYVLPGTYRLDETFTLGPEDSGTETAPIVYRGLGKQKPVLSGGKVLRGFRPYRGEILQCDIKANGLAGARFRQLFFRGERQVLARYPNLDPKDPHGGKWAHVAAVEGSENHTEFRYGADERHDWAHPEDAQIPIFGGYDWAFNVQRIAKHIPQDRRIVLSGRTWGPLRIGDRYFVEGLLEELDAPGEWYLDPRTDTLYFWPPDDIQAGEVVAPVIDTVISMENAAHVTLRGFVIEACDGDGVRMINCERCVAAGSVVRNSGKWGIVISGGHQSGARGNDVHSCGHGGISVSGGDRKTLAPANNFADNNYIHHCAVIWKTYRPGVRVSGVGNTVSHNLIHDMPHAGLLLAGNENVVEFNVVHHVNLQSADTGGIYFCSRDWTQRGNVIRYNMFHHCGGFGKANSWAPVRNGKVEFRYPHFTWGIYLDDPTTGTLVYGNILYNVPICALHNHGGRDNTFENNVLVDAPAFRAGMLSPSWSEWKPIYEKLRAARYPGSPYLQRYPEIAEIADTHPEEMSGLRFLRNIVYYTAEGTKWMREERGRGWGGENCQQLYSLSMRPEDFENNEWDYNCIYAEPGLELRVDLSLVGGERKALTWDEWRQHGKDATSEIADPLFVDPKKHDYRLKPDSPALRLGFKPIPVEKIGPYEDELRASWPIEEAPGAAALGDFVTVRYYEPPQYRRVKASEFTPRDGAGNFFAKATAGRPLRVAYFGGGIHPASGWRKRVIEWLRKRYGDVTEIDASICDCVRGSGFSVYRFRHDVLAPKPDLVLVAVESDDHAPSPDAIPRAIEGVVRQAWGADPRVDLVFLYAFRIGYERDYAEGLAPYAVSAYERIAEHYGIPSVNMGYRVTKLHERGRLALKASEDEDVEGEALFSRDGVRPAPYGDEVYAAVITKALQTLAAGAAAGPHELPEPYEPDNLECARQAPIAREMLSGEWRELPPDDPLRKRFARHMDTIWFTNTPGSKLTFKFKGSAASIFDIFGPDTGRVRITVDGEDAGVRQQVDPWSYFQRLGSLRLASGLPHAVHSVSVELLPDPPDRSVAIEAAKREGRYDAGLFEGVALRFGWIRVVGEVLAE